MEPETATAVPRTPVSCTVTIRGHRIVQDKPPAYGGQDDGPMASEILLASLLACQLSTAAKLRKKRNVEADVESITAECRFDEAGDISSIALAWRFASGQPEQVATLVRLTDRVCTISRALKVPIESRFEIA